MSCPDSLSEDERGVLESVVRDHGTPTFVYFTDRIAAQIDALRLAFAGRFLVSYAMKCNPNPAVLKWMSTQVEGLDVSSRGELLAGLSAGWAPERISFTGPAKQRPDLEVAVRSGTGEVVLESLREARLLDQVAQELGTIQRVLIRISPSAVPKGFGSNMSGKATQFGVDEEELLDVLDEMAHLRHLSIVGFHAYSGTQCLKADAIAENWLNFMRLFEMASEHLDIVPERLVFGSGLGIRYHEGDSAVDLEAVAQRVLPEVARLTSLNRFSQTQLLLETGRFLVGEAGIYLARVVHTKASRGRRVVVLDGGMNHHLGAAGHLGMVIHRPYRMQVLTKPSQQPSEPQDLYGPLCTTIDTLGKGVALARLDEGDVLAVHASGAYGPSSSPSGFISHPRAQEFMVVRSDREVALIPAAVD